MKKLIFHLVVALFIAGDLITTAAAREHTSTAPGVSAETVAVHALAMASVRTDSGDADGTRTYTLDEVVVTSTRQQVSVTSAPSAVSVVTFSGLQQKAGSTLGSALEGLPGLFVRSLGGGNSVQTVSVRGTYSEHTLVLVDGLRFNSFQNSQTDFGIFPVTGIERVEIVKGGFSALYGADAVGGVINVITRKPSPDLGLSASTSFGSSGFVGHEVAASSTEGVLGWRGSFHKERARGNYRFIYDDGLGQKLMRRNGADFDVTHADARFDLGSGAVNSWLRLSYTDADRGTPGALTHPDAFGVARLGDRIARTQLGLDWALSSQLSARLGSSFTYNHQTYVDPALVVGGSILQSAHTNRALSVSPEIHLLTPAFSGVAGMEFAGGRLVSTEADDSRRTQYSVYATTRHHIELPWSLPYEVQLYPMLRYDDFSDVRGDVSPRLGLNIGVMREPQIRVRSSYGKSLRVPTFNELHWKVGGNPDLLPERSLSFDAGVASTLNWWGTISFEANYFSIRTNDRIIWMPQSASIWSPRNIARVESEGVEVEARWTGFGGAVTLTMNSTWNSARKRSEDYPDDPTVGNHIIYVPRHTASFAASLTAGPFTLYLLHSWVSFRYTTEANDRFLPGYSTTSGSITYRLDLGWLKSYVKVAGTNIFDSSYQIIPLYPMPLGEFRTTLGVEL